MEENIWNIGSILSIGIVLFLLITKLLLVLRKRLAWLSLGVLGMLTIGFLVHYMDFIRREFLPSSWDLTHSERYTTYLYAVLPVFLSAIIGGVRWRSKTTQLIPNQEAMTDVLDDLTKPETVQHSKLSSVRFYRMNFIGIIGFLGIIAGYIYIFNNMELSIFQWNPNASMWQPYFYTLVCLSLSTFILALGRTNGWWFLLGTWLGFIGFEFSVQYSYYLMIPLPEQSILNPQMIFVTILMSILLILSIIGLITWQRQAKRV